MFWSYVYRGFKGLFFFPKYGLSGCRFGFRGCFSRVLWSCFSLFLGVFLVSVVENVLYLAFWGFSVRTAFFEGVDKRGFPSTLFWGVFGNFLAF